MNDSSHSDTPPPRHPDTPLFSHYPSIPPPIKLRLVNTGEHECPYLPDRRSSNRAFWAEEMPAELYRGFMDAGFRRSGKVVYQPVCRGCRQCVPIRIRVSDFTPGKSHRRVMRKNADLVVVAGRPEPTPEKFQLYHAYATEWHGKTAAEADVGYADFTQFLYESPVQTLEFVYRDPSGRLVGVGICDVSPSSLSSVYFYYDPHETRRGLGTFSLLHEIDYCRANELPYYYLGYWIAGCRTMDYKANYRPHELLGTDGVWRGNSKNEIRNSK